MGGGVDHLSLLLDSYTSLRRLLLNLHRLTHFIDKLCENLDSNWK